jgi:hypothetical protein
VGPATALLSYSWGNLVHDVTTALGEWAEAQHRDPAQTYIWICALCLNQLRIVRVLSPAELSAEFGPRVTAIGRILPLLAPWNLPVYTTRAWCLFELFTAIRNRRDVTIDIILPPSQRAAFSAAMKAGDYGVLEAVLDGIRAENATASEPADLAAIQTYVSALPGGFEALNETVRGHLRRWFEGQGAVLSAARVQALLRSSSRASDRSTGSPPPSSVAMGPASGTRPFDRSEPAFQLYATPNPAFEGGASAYEDDAFDVPLL